MSVEEKIKSDIASKFPALAEKLVFARPRRIFAVVSLPDFKKVLEYCIKEQDFTILCAITGLDEGAEFGFMYHLARQDGIMLSIKVGADRLNPVLQTITAYFPCADIYERELVDLLGARVEGLPPGNRYPLSDDWPSGEYPLRKDWKKQEGAK